MELPSETEKPPATQKDHTDETYERVFPDLSDEVLHELGQAENAEPHLTAATSSPATQPQALGLLAPAVAADIQPSSGPKSLPDNPQPAPLKSRYRRQASVPPAKITPTRLRLRNTPSKKYGSDVAERANAQRTQPPKSTSPSPPIPSQILAISLASSMPLPSDPSPANIATNDDPFQNSNVHLPTLNHGPYRYAATAIQSEKLPNPTPKVSLITPTTSGVENIPASGIPDHEFTKIFNNEYFAPLRLPPGPKDTPILKVSPPTPIPSVNPKRSKRSLSTSGDLRLPPGPNDTPLLKASPPTPIPSVTPKHSLPTGADIPTNYRLLLDDDSPTIGRLSKGKEDALITGLGSLDRLVKEIAVSSGLSVTQIVERWNGGTPRSLNSWNIYQAYIKQNLDHEIGRLITTKKSKGLS